MQTIYFLLSDEAAMARKENRKPSFVVHVECHSDMKIDERFIELDADDLNHGVALAKHWVENLGKTSAAVRQTFKNGKLKSPSLIV